MPVNSTVQPISGRAADPCVPKEKKCDGYFDCRSGKDEEGCSGIACRLDQFRCGNGARCIDSSLKCNHKNDCGDNSDENGCSKCRLVKKKFFSVITMNDLLFRFSTVSWRSIPMCKRPVYSSQFPLRWL